MATFNSVTSLSCVAGFSSAFVSIQGTTSSKSHIDCSQPCFKKEQALVLAKTTCRIGGMRLCITAHSTARLGENWEDCKSINIYQPAAAFPSHLQSTMGPERKAWKSDQTWLQVHEVSAPECVCWVSVSEIAFFNQEALQGEFNCRANTTAECFSLQTTASNMLLAGNNQPQLVWSYCSGKPEHLAGIFILIYR